jgi:hypothetical protein
MRMPLLASPGTLPARAGQHAKGSALEHRRGRDGAGVLSRRRRAGICQPSRWRTPLRHHAAILRGEPAGTGTRRHRLPRVLLPLPRARDRPANLAVRAVHDRHRHPPRRRAHGRGLLRQFRPGGARGARARRGALRQGRLELGVERGGRRQPRMAARDGIHPLPLAGLQRGADPLRPRPRVTHPSNSGGQLRGLDRDVRVEKDLRSRIPPRRPAVHAPDVSLLDRLSRDPGRVHARPRDRLFREQPAGDLRPAAVRDPKSARVRRLRRALLGHHRRRRARTRAAPGAGRRAALLRLQGERRAGSPPGTTASTRDRSSS